jgi:pyridoxine kinase
MKQVLLINDVVGYGKVGMGAMLPILSYLGIPTYSLPTALVSNTLDYGKFNIQDTTEYIRGTLPVWKELGFGFDAVCTGLMFSEEQAQLVSAYCNELHKENVTVFVDPIMGDAGKLYNGMTEKQVVLMREMVSVADLIFPNYTEACYLTNTAYKSEGMTWEEGKQMLDNLIDIGTKSALITSAYIDGNHCVIGRRSKQPIAGFQQNINEGLYFKIDYEEIPVLFHGTGDIFSAVLIGHLLKGEPLKLSTQTAMVVVSQLIEHNRNLNDKCCGIPIEQCLNLL